MEHAEAVKLIKDYGFSVLKHQNNWLGEAYEALLRALLSASIADTAGAKPVTGPWPTDAMNAAGMRELAAFHKSRGDTVDAIYLAMSAAAPPAPSVADAKCMCSGLGPCEKLSNCRKAPSVADAAGASEDDSWPNAKDAAIKACALMIKGICMTKPKDEWAAQIEKRIRFMLKDSI